MDRLLSMESFAVAVHEGTITAAAKRLGAAKSVISKRISDLEDHLGAQLLVRQGRRLGLTDAGRGYHEQAKRILAELTDAENSVAGESADLRGTLRVAAPMSFGTLHLAAVLIDLMRAYPELTIELDLNDRYVDLATEGHDFAIRIGRLPDSGLIARTIATNRHLICASPDYRARRGSPATPDHLREHDGLLYSLRESHGMWQLEVDGEFRFYRIRARMRCNNGEVMQAAALGGLGLAILPTFMAAPHLASGALRAVLEQHRLPGGEVSAVYLRDRHVPARVRVFIDALLAAYSPVAPWDL